MADSICWCYYRSVLSLLIILITYSHAYVPRGCDSYIDLTFIVDSSESIIEDDPYGQPLFNWNRVTSFIKGIISDLPISGDESIRAQVSILNYAEQTHLVMHMDQYQTAYDMLNHLEDSLLHVGGNTDTAQALDMAKSYAHDFSYGRRSDARNVVVVITDGLSNRNTLYTEQKAEELRQLGSEIYVIALEEDVDDTELNAIASEPSSKYVIHKDFYNDDSRVQELAIYRMCNLPDPTPAPPKCDIKIDLALVIDNSGSIADKNVKNETNHTIVDNYQTLKSFLKSMMDILDVGQFATRVGAVRFSHIAIKEFNFDSYFTREPLKKAIDNMHFTGSTTNTSGALRLARWELFDVNHGDRPNQNDVVLLITDGESNVDQNLTIREAEILKNRGARIFVVGVTNKINETELKAIASDPDKDHYFNSTSIANLDYIRNNLLKHVCHEGATPIQQQQQQSSASSGRKRRSLQCKDKSCLLGAQDGVPAVMEARVESDVSYMYHFIRSLRNLLGLDRT